MSLRRVSPKPQIWRDEHIIPHYNVVDEIGGHMPASSTPLKHYQDVFGRRMAYVESGAGDPIVLLHGNPTSSYLWRNVIPYLTSLGRCIAPDLIGMGDSDKLPDSGPGSYTFVEHRRYLDALFDQLGVAQQVRQVDAVKQLLRTERFFEQARSMQVLRGQDARPALRNHDDQVESTGVVGQIVTMFVRKHAAHALPGYKRNAVVVRSRVDELVV
jgi:hypothetical protein